MNHLITGYCTPDASARRASSLHNDANFVTRHDLTLSSLGCGTYLGLDDEKTQNSIVHALCSLVEAGLNVIDTAPNYRNGLSELAVGDAVQEICLKRGIPRNSLFVSTKVGILTEDYDCSNNNIIGDYFCYDPSYILESVENSRARLGIETIDCLYIHNIDEAQMFVTVRERQELIDSALRTMRLLVTQGIIRYFGLATWYGLRVAVDHLAHVSLADWIQSAERNDLRRHFGFIQLPLGAWAPEALVLPLQFYPKCKEPVSALDMARRLGLGVMANSSLYQGELLTVDSPNFSSAYELSPAQYFVQWARSQPQVDVLLLGMKSRESIREGKQIMMIPKTAKVLVSD